MGFPDWTLWGMGLSVAGALLAITLSWLGQSPQLLRRLGLTGARLDLRVRAFTGYALALLLLAIAFFLAGVPLGSLPEPGALAQQSQTPATIADSELGDTPANAVVNEPAATPATPETGSFSGPPASDLSSAPVGSPASFDEPQVPSLSPSAEDTGSFTSTPRASAVQPSPEATLRPTDTPTPVPTETPFPTLTPTAIAGETALVSTSGSTLWLKRSPGGQNVVLVRDGEIVIIRSGRANQGGLLWREVATVTGVEGWLQDEFLSSDLESDG